MRDVESSTPGGFPERQLSWSPVALFRFSALTFNAHMIHYNESRTRNFEGHPGLVVHGPLNLINMLDYWGHVHGRNGALRPTEISYRATSPIYAGEDYKIASSVVDDATDRGSGAQTLYSLVVEKRGKPCMQGKVLAG